MKLSKCSGKIGKSRPEVRSEYIEMLRITIMKNVPDNADACSLGCLDLSMDTRKIELSRRFFDQMPSQAVAGGLHTECGETVVVSAGESVVSRGLDHVEPSSVP